MPIEEPFSGKFDVTSTSDRWYSVTPDDAADLPIKPRAIFVNVGGNVVMQGADGVAATFAVGDGQQVVVAPHRILSTGTTATGIIALI